MRSSDRDVACRGFEGDNGVDFLIKAKPGEAQIEMNWGDEDNPMDNSFAMSLDDLRKLVEHASKIIAMVDAYIARQADEAARIREAEQRARTETHMAADYGGDY